VVRLAAASLLLSGAGAGCSLDTGYDPHVDLDPLVGQYTMVSMDGIASPVVLDDLPFPGCTTTVTQGTLMIIPAAPAPLAGLGFNLAIHATASCPPTSPVPLSTGVTGGLTRPGGGSSLILRQGIFNSVYATGSVDGLVITINQADIGPFGIRDLVFEPLIPEARLVAGPGHPR
jgi:hypothetical protein